MVKQRIFNIFYSTVGYPIIYSLKEQAKTIAKFTISKPYSGLGNDFIKHLDEIVIEQDWTYLAYEDGKAVLKENSGPDLSGKTEQDPSGVFIIHSCTKESSILGNNKYEKVLLIILENEICKTTNKKIYTK